ncbi:hypothetical protein JOD24_003237 [Kroppenstedtia sanguinis]
MEPPHQLVPTPLKIRSMLPEGALTMDFPWEQPFFVLLPSGLARLPDGWVEHNLPPKKRRNPHAYDLRRVDSPYFR